MAAGTDHRGEARKGSISGCCADLKLLGAPNAGKAANRRGGGELPDCSGCRQRINSAKQKQAAAAGEPHEPKSRQSCWHQESVDVMTAPRKMIKVLQCQGRRQETG